MANVEHKKMSAPDEVRKFGHGQIDVVNIGGGKPSPLMDYIAELERALGQTAAKQFLPMQDGDVPDTTASPELLERLISYRPQTPISEGVPAFVGWFRQRYNL